MKIPKIKISKGTALTFAIAIGTAISGFIGVLNEHEQEKTIEDLKDRVSKLEDEE